MDETASVPWRTEKVELNSFVPWHTKNSIGVVLPLTSVRHIPFVDLRLRRYPFRPKLLPPPPPRWEMRSRSRPHPPRGGRSSSARSVELIHAAGSARPRRQVELWRGSPRRRPLAGARPPPPPEAGATCGSSPRRSNQCCSTDLDHGHSRVQLLPTATGLAHRCHAHGSYTRHWVLPAPRGGARLLRPLTAPAHTAANSEGGNSTSM